MIQKQTSDAIQRFIKENSTWKIRDDKLHKKFVFKNFIQAFGFMTQAAIIAERDKHHPEWFNLYKTVIVDLTTHEANGITQRDFDLATQMDKIADNFLA